MPLFSLSIHRDYACRHSGACCTSGWTIPVEAGIARRIDRALATGRVTLPCRAKGIQGILTFPEPSGEYVGVLDTDDDGRCVFFDAADQRAIHAASQDPHPRLVGRCTVHRALGHDALPHSCQQFPRVVVRRPSSTVVSLSHYCPTAVAFLVDRHTPLAIERDAGWLASSAPLEGLDARTGLPPLLRQGVLFSWAGFEQWERFVVLTLANSALTMDGALAAVAAAAERVRSWTAHCGDFDEWLATSLSSALDARDTPPALGLGTIAAAVDAYALAADAVGAGLAADAAHSDFERRWAESVAPAWPDLEPTVRRYLATRAWASWVAHEGGGIRAFVRWIAIVLGVLRVEMLRGTLNRDRPIADVLREAIRRADLLLVHFVEPRVLARCLAALDALPL